MLKPVGRQAAERLEFADCINPVRYIRRILAAPALQRTCDVQRIKDRKLKQPHELVVARVFEITKGAQTANAFRGSQPAVEKSFPQTFETRCCELFVFHATQ